VSSVLITVLPKWLEKVISFIVLMIFSLTYFIQFFENKKIEKNVIKFNFSSKEKKISPTPATSLKTLVIFIFVSNVDAFLSAIFINTPNLWLTTALFFVFSFISVYAGNFVGYKLSLASNFNFSLITAAFFTALAIMHLF